MFSPEYKQSDEGSQKFDASPVLSKNLTILTDLCKLSSDNNLNFEHTALVGVQHLLPQMLNIVQALHAMNMSLSHIFILGKIYSTQQSIVNQLKNDFKINVIETQAEKYKDDGLFSELFNDEVKICWNLAEEKLKKSIDDGVIDTVLIIDDGGNAIKEAIGRINKAYNHMLDNAHGKEKLSTDTKSLSFWKSILEKGCRLAAVEQTSAGLQDIIQYLDEIGFDRLTFPIILVASCALKTLLEVKLIAEHFLSKFHACYCEHIANYTNDNPFQIGIIGRGNIGGSLESELQKRYGDRIIIRIYDKDDHQEEKRLIQGKKTLRVGGVDYLERLCNIVQKSDCIIGCTGTEVFDQNFVEKFPDFFENLNGPKIFLSSSSENREFFGLIHWLKTQRQFIPPKHLLDSLCHYEAGNPDKIKIELVYRGYPFNFSSINSSNAEGLDPKRFQIIIGALLGGLIQAQSFAVSQTFLLLTANKGNENGEYSKFFHQLNAQLVYCHQAFLNKYHQDNQTNCY